MNKSNLKVFTDVVLPSYLDSAVAEMRLKPGRDVVDLECIFLELTTQLMGRMAYDVGISKQEAQY